MLHASLQARPVACYTSGESVAFSGISLFQGCFRRLRKIAPLPGGPNLHPANFPMPQLPHAMPMTGQARPVQFPPPGQHPVLHPALYSTAPRGLSPQAVPLASLPGAPVLPSRSLPVDGCLCLSLNQAIKIKIKRHIPCLCTHLWPPNLIRLECALSHAKVFSWNIRMAVGLWQSHCVVIRRDVRSC